MRTLGQPDPCVVIAGDGVAASALACLLLGRDFGVVLLGRSTSARTAPVVEALPEATVRLFAEVGLDAPLAAAGATVVDGFENVHGPEPRRLDGAWANVDRSRLARACLTEARRRGATLVPSDLTVPPAFATVDATGRAARWSRPVARSGASVATLFGGAGRTTARPGRVVRTSDGWAYRLDHPDATTVGVVSRHPTPALDPDLAARLGVEDGAGWRRLGSRPASVQWATECVGERRVAVGDAALAYSPLAGQGLRFALASALAAASVLESWRDGDDDALAADYYRAFVEGARRRHLAKLAALDDPAGGVVAIPRPDPATRLRFTAAVTPAGVNVGGRIVTGDAVRLADGGLVRWVGGFDLLRLRALVGEGVTEAGAVTGLVGTGMTGDAAHALVAWARGHGVLAAEPVPSQVATAL